jgi:hypothetical protein
MAYKPYQAILCVESFESFSQVEALIKSNAPDSLVRMSRNAFDPMGTCRTALSLSLSIPWWLDAIFTSKSFKEFNI